MRQIGNKNTIVEYQGQSKKISEWSGVLGISCRTLVARYNRGYPIDSVMYKGNKSSPHLITYNGETRTLAEWAKHFNMPYSIIYMRYKNGHKGDDLFRPYDIRSKYFITINNVTKPLYVWAKDYNINYGTLVNRYNNGMRGIAIFEEDVSRADQTLTYMNKTQTIREWSNELNIPISRIFSRMRRGMPIDRILSSQSLKSILVPYEGELICLSDLAKKLGVSHQRIQQKYAQGRRGDDLIGKRSGGCKGITITYEGKSYSIKELSKHLNMPESNVRYQYVIKERNIRKKKYSKYTQLEHNGQIMTVQEWSKKLKITQRALLDMLTLGKTINNMTFTVCTEN